MGYAPHTLGTFGIIVLPKAQINGDFRVSCFPLIIVQTPYIMHISKIIF